MFGFQNKKTQLIEIVSNGIAGGNNSQRIQFPDQPYLRGRKIWLLETFSISDLTISPGGNALPTTAQLQGAYVTLYMDDIGNASAQGEYMQSLPLIKLRNVHNSTASQPYSWFPFQLAGQTIYWEKSYITLPTPNGLANTTNISFCFNVSFEDGPNN